MVLCPSRRRAAFTSWFLAATSVSQAVFFAVPVGIVGEGLLMWFSRARDTACGTWATSF